MEEFRGKDREFIRFINSKGESAMDEKERVILNLEGKISIFEIFLVGLTLSIAAFLIWSIFVH